MSLSLRRRLRLPSRIALMLGLGTLSVAGAKAHPAGDLQHGQAARQVPQQSAKPLAALRIWQEDGKVFISETGRPTEELQLGNTAEADALRELLRRQGATAQTPHALHDRVILVGAGGAGLHWESRRPDDAGKSQAPASGSSAPAPSHTAKAGEHTGPRPPSSAADNSK